MPWGMKNQGASRGLSHRRRGVDAFDGPAGIEPLESRLLMSGDQAAVATTALGEGDASAAITVEVSTANATATLPSKIKHISGHHDGVDSHFTNEVLPHFNVISGTSGNGSFLNQLRSQGKIYARHVTNPANSTSASQLVSLWRAPFDSGVISGGYDAIIIDEIHPEGNGSARAGYVASAFQQLRSLYPDKIILAWTRWQLSDNPGGYSQILNAIRDYADLNVIEQYLREGNPNLGLIPSWADRIKANIPGLLTKSIYGLYISQEGFTADDVTNLGYLGYLDEQFHRIRNDPDAASMPGVGFWVYYRSYKLTTGYIAQLVNHYYAKGNTSYLGNGNYNQSIGNSQFDSGTGGWTLSAGSGGSIGRVAYSSAGVKTYRDNYQQASHGTHGLRTVRGNGANTATTTVSVAGGQTHVVSAYVFVGSGSASQAKIRVTRTNGTVIATGTVGQTDVPVGQGDWKRVQFAFDVPQGVSSVNVILTDESVSKGTTLYWDFVELEDAHVGSTGGGGGGVNEAPTRVGALSVSNVAGDTARVSWLAATDANGDALTYDVQYRVAGTGASGWQDKNGGATRKVRLTGLQPQTSYDVRVRADDSELTGPWRRVNALFTTEGEENQPPSKPGDFTVSQVTDESAKVSWVASVDPDDDPLTYRVRYRVTGSSWVTATDATSSTSWDLTGLTAETSYDLRIVVTDSDLSASRNEGGLFTTLADGGVGDPEPPSRPDGVTASEVTHDSATITWNPSVDPNGDPITYRVKYREAEGAFGAPITTTATTLELTGLASTTTYDTRVVASDGVLSRARVEKGLFTTLADGGVGDPEPPSRPDGVTASEVTHDSATITWNPSVDPNGDPITYRVKYREAEGAFGAPITTTATTLELTGLASTTTYDTRVVASDGVLSRARVEKGLFTTLADGGAGDPEPPSKPSGVSASDVGPDTATITWDPSVDLNGDPVTYLLRYRPNGTTAWTAPVETSETRMVLTDLAPLTAYDVRIVATDSELSRARNVLTLFTTPQSSPAISIWRAVAAQSLKTLRASVGRPGSG